MINHYPIKNLELVVNSLIAFCNQNRELNLIPEISKAISRLGTNITSYQQSLSIIKGKRDSNDISEKVASLQAQLLHDIASPLAMLGFLIEFKKITLSESHKAFMSSKIDELRAVHKEIKNNLPSVNPIN